VFNIEEKRPIIFYGAGHYAETNLSRLIDKWYEPACFVDADENKHYKKLVSNENRDYVILPLDEAIKRYPDYQLIITVVSDPFSVYKYLLDLGVQKERFITGEPQWCPMLGTSLVLQGRGLQSCCNRPGYEFCIPSRGNITADIEQYRRQCSSLSMALNEGLITTCTGCDSLQDGYNTNQPEIKSIIFGTGLPGGNTCNLECVFCHYEGKLDHFERDDNILEIFKYIAENLQPKTIAYAAGEIAVSPYRDEILGLWISKGWGGLINTNATLFCDGIAQLLSKGLITLNCSLDAGTPQTFAKIKNVDCFQKVMDNLTKYSQTGGRIELKYIILDEINDNDEDVQGFVFFAKQINAPIQISRDCRVTDALSEKGYDTLVNITKLCTDLDVDYAILTTLFEKDLYRLRSDNIIN